MSPDAMGPGRRAALWANLALQALLLAAVLVILNVILARFPARYDFT
jgi:hypothetical protein